MRRGVLAVMLASLVFGATARAQRPNPYFEFQVEKPAVLVSGAAKYPDMLRSARVEGMVLAQFVVDDSGRYEPESFKVLKSSHELFTQAVKVALPGMQFSPALLGGKSVRQLVQQPFVFDLSGAAQAPGYLVASDGIRPAEVRFGATLAELQRGLATKCTKMETRRIDPPFKVLRDLKDKQFQIDCDGFHYMGRMRHAEFVIADDALEMVWIMTDKSEAQTLNQKLKDTYGAEDMSNDKFVSYQRGRVALRVDVPEVLFYSERLAPRVAGWFGPKSTF